MRNRRLLQMMAGQVRSPAERRADREVRRFRRLNSEAEQRLLLVDRIRQRELGVAGEKPMPFAKGEQGMERSPDQGKS
jgi:hypothetical protein